MANDLQCPVCRADAPAGRLQQAVAAAGGADAPALPLAARGSAKRKFALAAILIGSGFLAVAFFFLLTGRSDGQKEDESARRVTSADLLRVAEVLPEGRISYTFDRSKPTGIHLFQNTMGRRDVKSSFILVGVQDKWMIARVPAGFTGNRLVGELRDLDSPLLQNMLWEIRLTTPSAPGLLPYEFNTVDRFGTSGDSYLLKVGLMALLGLIGIGQGLYVLIGPKGGVSYTRHEPG
jgi:hypothetical protein